MKYISPVEAATAAGLSHQRIRALLLQGRIVGAKRVGNAWIIPTTFSIARNGTRGPKSTITGPQL